MRALIEHGSNQTAKTADGRQALWIASSMGNIEAVKLLVSYTKTNLNDVATDKLVTPLWVAAQNGHLEVRLFSLLSFSTNSTIAIFRL